MISRELRLRSPIDFERVRSLGTSWPTRLIVAVILPNGREDNRYGFAVGRRVGNAVARNRAKRLMRESVRNLHPSLPSGYDIVFIARNAVGPETTQIEIDRAIAGALNRASLIARNQSNGTDQPGSTPSESEQ